jgi:hypothetical protein
MLKINPAEAKAAAGFFVDRTKAGLEYLQFSLYSSVQA